MNLLLEISDLQRLGLRIEDETIKRERSFTLLVSGIVALHQRHRLAKNYALSDELRDILAGAGIQIKQGTAGYKYDEIPRALQGRQINDTWELENKERE